MSDDTNSQLDEARANLALDAILQNIRIDDDSDSELSAPAKLHKMFGDAAPVVMQLMLLSMVAGHEIGLVDGSTASDRTEVLVNALRKVHRPEMFHDCEADGDVYPCKTARMLNLVAGNDPYAVQEDGGEAA